MKDIVYQIQKERTDFDKPVKIASVKDNGSARFLSNEENTENYRQQDVVNRVDLYTNSLFEKGKVDNENQRKLFLNVVNFAQKVAEKQTDMDVKNFHFLPKKASQAEKVQIFRRKFGHWTREEQYNELINALNRDFTKYGTCVSKRVGESIDRVSLRKLKNTQDADSLSDAANSGGYVIEEHNMTVHEMKQMPDWKTDEIQLDDLDRVTVWERHGLVPLAMVKEFNDEGVDEEDHDEMVLAVTFETEDVDKANQVLFMQEEDDVPYEEAHYDKQDGRWLGIGEVEAQFENQVAANLTANLQRRNMLWATKKIFQSTDGEVADNLIRQVSDGGVIEIESQGGQISQIDMQTQHNVDFNNAYSIWQENGKQKSFTFEAATGETMPSGTPFRLGVVLSNATQRYFDLKRETFGLFLERSFFNHLIPIFKKEMRNSEHTLALMIDDEGIEDLQESIQTAKTNKRLIKRLVDKNLTRNLLTLDFNFDAEKERIRSELARNPYESILKFPKGYFDDARFDMKLIITGEQAELDKQIETLATIYQSLPPEDERRERVLKEIVRKTGMSAEILKKRERKQSISSVIQQNGQTNTGGAASLQSLIQSAGGQADTTISGAGDTAGGSREQLAGGVTGGSQGGS